ncbi:PaaI family thioesterase [Amylibacter sp. SFDW26]|uniref:PaaI family thioesterase n=1 Tax=Amylibacter sp. SFDW26 TaxID=2652722 RepID=UPI0012629EAB|nr:PaaI family thioesterase [Amylibacter sp. SFDW26]KAB7613739.1 PaaI family thioesterase [Amylibacter sp. SFDW26]
MSDFKPRSVEYEQRVRDSFARQVAMQTLGITLDHVAVGHVDLSMPYHKKTTQQHGFVHAGIITTALDSAAGYAAYSLMADEAAVLTAEFKTSLLAPADGERFIFRGEVLKPGRTLTFTESRAYAVKDGSEKLIAVMTATMMAVTGRNDVVG